jgi:hypothetical protein
MANKATVTVSVFDLHEVKALIARLSTERDEARKEAEHWEAEYWKLLGDMGGVSSP